MEFQLKADMILMHRPRPIGAEAMAEYTGIKIIEALEIILKDCPEQQKAQLMDKVDEVIEQLDLTQSFQNPSYGRTF